MSYKLYSTLREAKTESYDSSCVLVKMPKETCKILDSYNYENIPDDCIAEGKKRETEYHVTILYGIEDTSSKETLELLKNKINSSTFKVRLGAVSKFYQDDYDVVKIDIDDYTGKLEAAFDAVNENIDNRNEYDTYHPHCTLAYVKKGTCEHLIGDSSFEGVSVVLNELKFSSPDEEETLLTSFGKKRVNWNAIKEEIRNKAQSVLDDWNIEDENNDIEGGACDIINEEIQTVLIHYGFIVADGGQEGDDHVYSFATDGKDYYRIDIPYYIYETGAGYSWKKLPDVKLTIDDIVVEQVDRTDVGDLFDLFITSEKKKVAAVTSGDEYVFYNTERLKKKRKKRSINIFKISSINVTDLQELYNLEQYYSNATYKLKYGDDLSDTENVRYLKAQERLPSLFETVIADLVEMLSGTLSWEHSHRYSGGGEARPYKNAQQKVIKEFTKGLTDLNSIIYNNVINDEARWGEIFIAIDNVINYMHIDFPYVEHMMMEQEQRIDQESPDGISDYDENVLEKQWTTFLSFLESQGKEIRKRVEGLNKKSIRVSKKVLNEFRKLGMGSFDLTSTGMPHYDAMLDNPEYYKKEKGLTFTIESISPEEYLERCSERINMSVEEWGGMKYDGRKELVNIYKDKLLAGEIFPMPMIDYSRYGGQEGRHRALAAQLAGMIEIPVMIIKDAKKTKGRLITEKEIRDLGREYLPKLDLLSNLPKPWTYRRETEEGDVVFEVASDSPKEFKESVFDNPYSSPESGQFDTYRGVQTEDNIFNSAGELLISFHSTINCIAPIVKYLLQRGWELEDSILISANLCEDCLNICLEELDGGSYEEDDWAGTSCSYCEILKREDI